MSLLTSSQCFGCSAIRRLLTDKGFGDFHKKWRCFSAAADAKRKTRTRMKAWQIHQYGSNDEFNLYPAAKMPRIQDPKDILVQVHAASVNPIDVRMREGYGRNLLNQMRKSLGSGPIGSEFPLILGRDFSGVVMETGRGVTRFKPGDEVWGALGGQRQGTHAEFTVAGEREISLKPKSLSHIEAASIPYVAMTTWAALCLTGGMTEKTSYGSRILIHGGSGGIGTFAIQLMKSWGATVITTCATDAVPMVTELGADHVIDYKTQNVVKELKKLEKMDAVLDPLGGETPSFSLDILKTWQNAKYITLVMPLLPNTDRLGIPAGLLQSAASLGYSALKSASKGRSYRWAFFIPDGNAMEKVAKLVDNGKIRPIIDKVFDFEELPEAYTKVGEVHGRGKTVLKVLW